MLGRRKSREVRKPPTVRASQEELKSLVKLVKRARNPDYQSKMNDSLLRQSRSNSVYDRTRDCESRQSYVLSNKENSEVMKEAVDKLTQLNRLNGLMKDKDKQQISQQVLHLLAETL